MDSDRVRSGQEWEIEFTLGGQHETETFRIIGEERPLPCEGRCETVESMATMTASVSKARTDFGEVILRNDRSGQRTAAFKVRQLGRFNEASCSVVLGAKQDKYTALFTPEKASYLVMGSCRVLSVR
ncbi:hypothetical protein GCM10010844_30750 [Deinococcus radiotolerans]|uniref:Uncharacterized protein n=1 Tax=Deinococcus radiotolerans TaxID=1309407 RepID=A0ABQ2FLH0_9DEIO|nr:hypothetical protein GCM10010844_30750 [Deinococcus radiotolerans]